MNATPASSLFRRLASFGSSGSFGAAASALALAAASVVVVACSSGGSGSRSSSGGPEASDEVVLDAAACAQRCEAKLGACGVPGVQASQGCASACADGLTQSQALCLEQKSCEALEEGASVASLCPRGEETTPDPGGPPGGGAKEGDACKCTADGESGGGEFTCSGTSVCGGAGLVCVGVREQGVDRGTCMQRCCATRDECAAVLGKQGTCSAGMRCLCRDGVECVGDTCTCPSGVVSSQGYCSE